MLDCLGNSCYHRGWFWLALMAWPGVILVVQVFLCLSLILVIQVILWPYDLILLVQV